MIPVDCVHNGLCPRRLPFEEVLSDGDGGVSIQDSGLIIVCYEHIRDGERGKSSWRRYCCRSRMPASVSDSSKFSCIFVAPHIELDF